MSFGQWYTLEDVTQDLAKASGQLVNGLNEKHVVVGERKPRYNKEEEEFEEVHNYDMNLHIAQNKPDLRGITELIRMVNGDSKEFESPLEESENIKKMKENFNKETFVISKLNPEVPSFVPKFEQAEKNLKEKNNKTEPLMKSKETQNNEVNETKHNSGTNTYTNICEKPRIDLVNLDPQEKQKLQERLKSDIRNTSHTNCIKSKRQRNLAIATLLKLYSSPSPSKTAEEPKPKLITPQYFEICDKKIDQNLLGGDEDTYIQESGEGDSLEVVSTNNKVTEWLDRGDTSPETQHTSVESVQQESNENIDVSPAEVKNSIDKVSKWLSGREEQSIKSPVLFVGPITFKRKHPRNSPVTQTSSSNETQVSETTKNYEPSPYASELSDRYMKRMKEREVTKDIWTKLEEDLKLKDNIIKNKSVSSLGS